MKLKQIPCPKGNCKECVKSGFDLTKDQKAREIKKGLPNLSDGDCLVLICNLKGFCSVFRILKVNEGRKSISDRRMSIALTMAEKEKRGMVLCM